MGVLWAALSAFQVLRAYVCMLVHIQSRVLSRTNNWVKPFCKTLFKGYVSFYSVRFCNRESFSKKTILKRSKGNELCYQTNFVWFLRLMGAFINYVTNRAQRVINKKLKKNFISESSCFLLRFLTTYLLYGSPLSKKQMEVILLQALMKFSAKCCDITLCIYAYLSFSLNFSLPCEKYETRKAICIKSWRIYEKF